MDRFLEDYIANGDDVSAEDISPEIILVDTDELGCVDISFQPYESADKV